MPKARSDAPFAYDGLDRVIHEKARLGVLTSLVAHPKGLAFADLKALCDLTDGNLSRHLKVLQDAGSLPSGRAMSATGRTRPAGSPLPDANVWPIISPFSNKSCAMPPRPWAMTS